MTSPNYTMRQLAYLVAVAERGTLARAATELHVSPSALSVALDELDSALGVKLTVRRRAHGVRLTPAGRTAVARARRLLHDAEDLTAAVGGAAGDPAGTVSVGCYPTLAPTVLAPWIATLARHRPRIRIDLVEQDQNELRRALHEGELDLAVLYDFRLERTLERRRLAENVAHLLVHADHRLAGEPCADLQQVADEPMILLDLPPASEHALGVCHQLGVSPDIAHRTQSADMVRALVGAGMGWSILAQTTAVHASDTVQRVALAHQPAPLPVVVAWAHVSRPGPAVRAVLEAAPSPVVASDP